ncbi:MAG: hypothetical protein ACYCPS_02645 [Candidatus Saccharimonadales bacterium]
MDDALNSDAWVQPNTFMDIIAPSKKQASARSKPDKSKTLMRTAVKRPDFGSARNQSTKENLQPAINNYHPNLSEAAALTDKSPLISRFAPSMEYQQPETEAVSEFEPQPEPVDLSPASFSELDAQPMAIAAETPAINVFKSGLPELSEYAQTAKEQVGKWKLFRRLSGWTVLAVIVIGVVAGGVLINSNLGRIELYLASSKAGFAATLPSISPAGYDLSSVGTGSGTIEASFKSNSDNRSYTLSEKKSSVPSSVMLDNYVQSNAGLNFQSINTDGKTIYIYNGHDATWVSKGIWYIIQDNNSLSNRQIIDIANSM